MQSKEWLKIKEVFAETVELSEVERLPFLVNHADDVRVEVEKLLKSYQKLDNFIEQPAIVEVGLDEKSLIGTNIGDYKIIREIAEGGMGLVYLAERQGFEQNVAIKIIKRGMDSRAILKRFVQERQILSRLNHPNIAKLLDGGTTESGSPYFVMEYVDGENIIEFCENQRFDVTERLDLFRQVCSAISYAHQNLIVHRDIKPSNIIVTTDGTPKLLDFGIAKLLDNETENTATQARILTPEYASPEQLNGLPITTSADVYSLGVVLYELLSGVRPFKSKSKSYAEIANLVLTVEPVRPSYAWRDAETARRGDTEKNRSLTASPRPRVAQSLSTDVDNIILKAIRKEPERRYSSVQEFSEDIRRNLHGLPVTATADSASYRFKKFVGRNKQTVLVASLLTTLILAISTIAIWQAVVATYERDKANKRFLKLRETAKSLMTETRDSLDYVPGTINIRKVLSEKSVDLLDSVYDETGSDSTYFKELADSYEKLGRTQLWEFHDFENAKKACKRAIEIRRKNINLEPTQILRKIELADSLSTLTEILYFQKNGESSENIKSEIESILRENVVKEPNAQNLSKLAQHLLGFVGTYKEFETVTENEQNLREAIEIFQNLINESQNKELSTLEKTDLAWVIICQAMAYRKLNADENAFLKFQKAGELAENAYRADNTMQVAFNYTGFVHRNLGEIYEKRHEYQRALERYQFSFDWLKLRENNELQSKPYLAWAMSNSANRCALMLQKLGRQKVADEMIAKPWKAYLEFLNTESNAASLEYAEEPLNYLTNYYAATNRTETSIEIWRTHYNRVQKFLDKNPNDVGFLQYQAVAQKQIGDIYSGYDSESKSYKTNDKTRILKAKLAYQKAIETYEKAHSMYSPTQGELKNLTELKERVNRLK